VRDVSFSLQPGETLGIVGESGSGKSMTALALMRLLPPGGRVEAERLRLNGRGSSCAGTARLEELRGSAMGMIFQEPMTALNPVLTIGEQLIETVRRHTGIGRREARDRAIEALRASAFLPPNSGSMSIRIACPAACASA
jgi:peptide/nickel transport system ATP-binding protein